MHFTSDTTNKRNSFRVWSFKFTGDRRIKVLIDLQKYHWQQIENIFHREKKFCIEATDQLQRRSSADAKSLFAVEPRIKSRGEVKVYSWYGNTALIKTIWQMSVSQHKYFLDNQRKVNTCL